MGARSSAVEHLAFNQSVPGSIPGGLTFFASEHMLLLIGRSNVGKSSLFNLLSTSKFKSVAGGQLALTRDCNISPAKIGKVHFTVGDTPGIESLEQCPAPLLRALAECDLVGFMVDAKSGILPADVAIAKGLLSLGKRTILLVNKCDGVESLDRDYYRLGPFDLIRISAAHKLGIEAIAPYLAQSKQMSESGCLSLAVIGRPNVGKSTFTNSILGFNRQQVSAQPGMTRDAIATEEFFYKGSRLRLIDTAGLRKKASVEDGLETLFVASAIRAIESSDVSILMLECGPLSRQDIHILQIARSKRRSFVVAANKVDTIAKSDLSQVKMQLQRQVARIANAPVICFSALSKRSSFKVLEECLKAYKCHEIKPSTSQLNLWLKQAASSGPSARSILGKTFRVKYCACIGEKPLLLKVFCNRPEGPALSYKKYLANNFKKHFSIFGSDVSFVFACQGKSFK